jgi:triphosphoribosyl-dephospho-CoA synthase
MRHTTAECVSLACLLEATAPKPGNVHRGADFDDLTFTDLAVSGTVIGPILARAGEMGVGQAILKAVEATRDLVGTNSNLGMVLLLAPLAAVPRDEPLREGVAKLLRGLHAEEARSIWAAIALAKPGGMGQVATHDVAGPAPEDILEAMRLAAGRDRIAAQYANEFTEVFDVVVPQLVESAERFGTLTEAIVYTHVRLMAELPDTLIARKAGSEVAERSAQFARQVLEAGGPGDETYYEALADFDFWLRSDGRRRNPGTTADLIAAGLFVLLRDELIDPPYR